MTHVYLVWSLILLGMWAAVFAAYAPGRRKMLRMSLVTLPLGLTEPLFVPAYWLPPTLFDLARYSGFDVESLLFAFAAGGIAATLYDALSGARWQALTVESRSAGRHRWHALALATPVLVFPSIALSTTVNPIYSTSIALLAAAVASVFCRPDLWPRTLLGAAVFALLYFMFFLSLVTADPLYVPSVWNLSELSGVLIFGVPLEELMFAASLGAAWSGLYEHLTWRATRPRSST